MKWKRETIHYTFFGIDVSDNPIMLKVMGWMMISFSIVCLIAGVTFLTVMLLFFPGTQSTHGTILSCHFDRKGECAPTLRFVTQSGRIITFTPSDSSGSYHQGDVVSVRYYPNSPQDAQIDDGVILWLFPLITSGSFLLLFFGGRYVLTRAAKLRAEQMGATR